MKNQGREGNTNLPFICGRVALQPHPQVIKNPLGYCRWTFVYKQMAVSVANINNTGVLVDFYHNFHILYFTTCLSFDNLVFENV